MTLNGSGPPTWCDQAFRSAEGITTEAAGPLPQGEIDGKLRDYAVAEDPQTMSEAWRDETISAYQCAAERPFLLSRRAGALKMVESPICKPGLNWLAVCPKRCRAMKRPRATCACVRNPDGGF